MKKLLFLLFFFTLFGMIFVSQAIKLLFFAPRPPNASVKEVKRIPPTAECKTIEIVAQNLSIPWEIAFLPEGGMLITERAGKLLRLEGTTKVIKEITGVAHVGEGGLLGLALHPDFAKNRMLYLYLTAQGESGLENRVERYNLKNDTLTERKVILDGIKGSSNHDGGRMAFGPDGYLYITTGDAEDSTLAQNKTSLNGKILRIKDDGTLPADNPFGNAVYSYGHRNPQGLAWTEKGELWITEHGPSGFQSGYDEVNRIQKGGNYGWPIVFGNQDQKEFVAPVIQSGSTDTWAPSGMLYYQGSLFFAGLRGEAVYKAKINKDNTLALSTYLREEYGRIRTIALGADGYFYLCTSNTDGRGTPRAGDDKLIRVSPNFFE